MSGYLPSPKQHGVTRCLTENEQLAYGVTTAATSAVRIRTLNYPRCTVASYAAFFTPAIYAFAPSMADCVGQPSGWSFPLDSDSSNPARSATFRFEPKAAVFNLSKETVMSNPNHAGIAPGVAPHRAIPSRKALSAKRIQANLNHDVRKLKRDIARCERFIFETSFTVGGAL